MSEYTSITFKSRLTSASSPLLGIWLNLGSLEATSYIAHQLDYDFMIIDAEHVPLSPSKMTQMVQAVGLGSGGRTAPLVRLPASSVEWVKWALDSGASGIIPPMVNTPQQMRDILASALYPPRGQRSFGPFQAPLSIPRSVQGATVNGATLQRPNMMTYVMTHSKEVAVLPLIESREGLENIEAILEMEGVDGCFVGPVDLCLSLGLPPMASSTHPPNAAYAAALERVLQAAKNAGNKPVGIVVDVMGKSGSDDVMQLARAKKEEGFALMTIGSDVFHLADSLRNTLVAAKRVLQ